MSTSEFQELWDAEMREATAEGFVVETDDQAAWCLAKLAQAQAAIARRAEECRVVLARLERVKAHDAQDERTIERMTAFLRGYWVQLVAAGKVTGKHYDLHNGRLSVRRQETRWIRDDDALLKSLEGRYTKIRAEVDWAELKKAIVPLTDQPFSDCLLVETGEVLAGLRVQRPPTEHFSATPSVE